MVIKSSNHHTHRNISLDLRHKHFVDTTSLEVELLELLSHYPQIQTQVSYYQWMLST